MTYTFKCNGCWSSMQQYFNSLLIVTVMALMVTACTQQASRTMPEEAQVAADTVPPEMRRRPVEKKPEISPKNVLPRVRVFKIDSNASEVRIYAYRSGKLAHLGYNHLIVGKDIHGTIVLGNTAKESRVDIKIPVKTLIVDDPHYRKEAGPEFKTQPPQSDIEVTQRNLLSSIILDAENYPLVIVSAKVAGGKFPDLELDVDVEIRNVKKRLRIPARLEKTEDRITASGDFTFHQTDFGIEPFSLLKGALTVKDEVRIQYRVVAHPSK